MSEKTTVSAKKIEKEELRHPTTYDIDEIFPDPPVKRRRSSDKASEILDKIAEDHALDLSRQYEEVKVKKALKQMQAEMGENAEDSKFPGIDMSPQLAEVLSKMDEETRRQTVAAMVSLKGKSGGSADSLLLMTTLAAGFGKANPNAQAIDIVKYAEITANQIRLGIELGRQNQPLVNPNNATQEAIALVKVITDLMKSQQPTTSGFDLTNLLRDDALFTRAKEIGIFGGGQDKNRQVDSQLGFEAIKYQTDVNFKIEQLRHEREARQEAAQFQQAADLQKWTMIQRMFDGPLGGVVSRLGNAAAGKISGGSGLPPASQVPVPIRFNCPECKELIFTSSDAKQVICPHCKAVLEADHSAEEIQASRQTGQQQQLQEQQQQQPGPGQVPQ